MTRYTKFVVALIMALYNLANQIWGITLPFVDETTLTIVVNFVLAGLVYALPNKPADDGGSVLRSPPVATGLAFALTLLFLGGALVGCAPAGGGAQPADTSGIQKNIAYAEGYVAVGKAAAATCIALKLPVCSTPAFANGVAKASAVADEAIAEAKSYPISGSTQDKINAALRTAMNAVLLFYSLR